MTVKEAAIKIVTEKAWREKAEKMMGMPIEKMNDIQFGIAAATLAATYELKGV